MPKRELPNLSGQLPSPVAGPSTEVSEEISGYEHWRQDSSLAPWVSNWLLELQRSHGKSPAASIFNGLGRRWHHPAWMQGDRPNPEWLRRFLSHGLSSQQWLEFGYLCDDPPWLEKLLASESTQVARSFLVSGNISDYAFDPAHGYRPAINVLLDHLARTKDCVLHYRLSKGLRLHTCSDSSNIDRLSRPMRELIEKPIPRKEASFESEIRTYIAQLN